MEQELRRLELPAKISSLPEITRFVREGAQAAALAELQHGHLELVLEEILVNVMRHAYPDGTRGHVEVGYAVEGPGKLFVQVSDAGRAFDPLAKDPAELPKSIADCRLGGLGIFLVKEIAQSLSYRRVGNRNILAFRLNPDPLP